jgi:hypothetical protein
MTSSQFHVTSPCYHDLSPYNNVSPVYQEIESPFNKSPLYFKIPSPDLKSEDMGEVSPLGLKLRSEVPKYFTFLSAQVSPFKDVKNFNSMLKNVCNLM